MQVSNSEIEVYAYGLEIILGALIKLALLAVLAVALDLIWPVIMVSLGLFGFRFLGGGSHLSTYMRCLVFGTTVMMGLAWLSTTPPGNTVLLMLLGAGTILSTAVIILRVPAGTEKKVVTDPAQISGQKKKTFVFMLLWGGLALGLLQQGLPAISYALILGGLMGVFSISTWGYSMSNGFDILSEKMERRVSKWAIS